MMLRFIWKLACGPQLFKVYRRENSPSCVYESNVVEKFSNSVLKWIRICWTFCSWTSPIIVLILYRRGAFSADGLSSLCSYGLNFSILILTTILARALGRCMNPTYREFLQTLITYENNKTSENKARLSKYDYCFSAWPVEFSGPKLREPRGHFPYAVLSASKVSLPLYLLSYICVKTFGIRLLYPGCVSMFQSLISQALMDGRERLIEEQNGKRAKVMASDGNVIDTMFVDKRAKDSEKGNVLVICSEGNAGFYEIGCNITPLEAGYSVLAWNHPGFSGSTGCPLPEQEQCAMDSVIQYSMNHLHFEPSNIILFAWSIGGYTAAWGAMMYPDIRCVILDATFDNILPLAMARMPPSWKGLIKLAMPQHLNLNNAELLCNYQGKILLIRRTKDEMITTSESGSLASNRGNNLLDILLHHRYPNLFNPPTSILQQWLASDKNEQNDMWNSLEINEEECQEIISNISDLPSDLGHGLDIQMKERLILFLARKHMVDYDASHCTPLPASYFREPKYL